jgi:hypothetical protein
LVPIPKDRILQLQFNIPDRRVRAQQRSSSLSQSTWANSKPIRHPKSAEPVSIVGWKNVPAQRGDPLRQILRTLAQFLSGHWAATAAPILLTRGEWCSAASSQIESLPGTHLYTPGYAPGARALRSARFLTNFVVSPVTRHQALRCADVGAANASSARQTVLERALERTKGNHAEVAPNKTIA